MYYVDEQLTTALDIISYILIVNITHLSAFCFKPYIQLESCSVSQKMDYVKFTEISFLVR